jgi:predicted nucleic acid-binding protein
MLNNLFLDSDVILDVYLDRMPFTDNTIKIFSLFSDKKVNLYVSALSISNIYYILKKNIDTKIAFDAVKFLIDTCEIIPTNKIDLKKAIELNFSDYEDAIQVASSMRSNKIQYILTRNVKDYHKSPIPVVTPEEFLIMHNY